MTTHRHPDNARARRDQQRWIGPLFLAAAVVGTAGVFGGTIAAAADVAPSVHAEQPTEPRPHTTGPRTPPTLSVAPVPLTTAPASEAARPTARFAGITTRAVVTTAADAPETVTVVPVTDEPPSPGVQTTAEREPVSSQEKSPDPWWHWIDPEPEPNETPDETTEPTTTDTPTETAAPPATETEETPPVPEPTVTDTTDQPPDDPQPVP